MKTKIHAILIGFAAMSLPAFGQSADELLQRGREAYMNYDFEDAARLYAQAKKKAKRTDEFFADKYDSYHRQLTDAENFLGRVEKIAVIDSITVPRADFFKAYRLPQSSGTLSGPEGLPGKRIEGVNYVFTNEGGDYKLWAQPDTTGYTHLVEANLLIDGKWSQPTPLSDSLSEDCDAIFPFMMADGVTLYYADNGENSIGGYDIMVATRDAADGSFLQPSNIGFPYNSPYDDYLLAIDELNGVGWWATDRNQLDDELTVYVFVVNDLRTNYSPDEDDVVAMARIDDYVETQPEDADYDSLLATIRAINPGEAARKPEFTFSTSKGRIFHFYDDLPSADARSSMRDYLDAERELAIAEKNLNAMRRRYHNRPSDQLGRQIADLEKQTEALRSDVSLLRSDVHKALK